MPDVDAEDLEWRAGHPPFGSAPLSPDRLKRWHQLTHLVFDRLWERKKKAERKKARKQAYRWLAAELGLTSEQCHIRLFDEATCRKVIELSKARLTWDREEATIHKRRGFRRRG